jgi:hypothetical protein
LFFSATAAGTRVVKKAIKVDTTLIIIKIKVLNLGVFICSNQDIKYNRYIVSEEIFLVRKRA